MPDANLHLTVKYFSIKTVIALLLSLSNTTWSKNQSNTQQIPDGAPIIQHYTSEDIGADTINWAVTQDSRGIMYFGNEDGVLEYDGARWKLIPLGNGILARSLDAGESGIAVGGIAEFGVLASDTSGETVYRSLSALLPEEQRKFGNVWSVHSTSHGAYFITNNYIYRWHHGKLETTHLEQSNWGFKAYGDVFVLHRGTGGISRLHNGKLERLPQTGKLKTLKLGRITILPYANGKLLIVSSNENSYIYHLDRLGKPDQNTSPLLELFPSQAQDYLKEKQMYYFSTHIETKQFIFTTLGGKLIFLNTDGSIHRILDEHNGLNGSGILDVFIDRDKNLWATTLGGIFHIDINSPWSLYDAGKLSAPILKPAIHQNELYISTYKGVYYLNTPKPSLDGPQYEFVKVDTPDDQSFALFSDNQHFYAAVQNKIYLVNRTHTKQLLELENNTLILSMEKSKRFQDIIFIGTYSAGLSAMKIRAANGTVSAQHITLNIPQLNKESIRYLYQDINEDLWVSTEVNGIYHIKFKNDDIYDFDIFKYGEQHGLFYDKRNALVISDHEVIVSTPKGVFRADLSGRPGENEIHFVFDKMLSNHLTGKNSFATSLYQYGSDLLVMDEYSTLRILHTNNDKITVDDKPFNTLLDTRKGINDLSIDNNQHIWVPLNTKLYRYYPNIKKNYQVDYPVYIRKVTTQDNYSLFKGNHLKNPALEQQSPSVDITASQAEWAIPMLDYSRNDINFEFSAAFYEHSPRLKYSYKLEGYDQQWSEWSSNNKKGYTNLYEGHYRFHVKARNVYGHDSQQDSYQFTILPPWYRTLWMYLAYIIAFIVFIIVSIRIYTWRLIQSRNRLDALVKQRTRELQKSMEDLKATQDELTEASHRAGMADVARNVLHNIGNILNSINTSNSVIINTIQQSKDADRIRKTASAIQSEQQSDQGNIESNSKLKKIIDYLREFSVSMKNKNSDLRKESDHLQNQITKIQGLLYEQKDYAQASNFSIETDIDKLISHAIEKSDLSNNHQITIEKTIPLMPLLMLDKYKVEKILIQLLNNAKTAIEETGQADMKIHIRADFNEDAQLNISISDNGVGIAADNLNKIFNHGFTTKTNAKGHGLHQCANAAVEMSGKLIAHSNGTGQGATFELQIPIHNQAHFQEAS